MLAYIIRRLVQGVIVLLLITIIIFLAMRLLPGDPVLMYLTQGEVGQVTEEYLAEIRHEAGLDRPLMVQYLDWLVGIVHGDLGRSILTNVPVVNEISRRVPVTLYLGLLAFIIGIVIGVPAGIICAIRRGSRLDTVITLMANIGVAMPVFWLGFIFMYLFGLRLGWFPTIGYTSPFEDFWLSIKQIIMPVICLAVLPISQNARQTRSSMLEVIRQDYIRTAWSKGLNEKQVIMKHALKNGLVPVITLLGVQLSHIIGGQVLIETVFVIPGMGLLAVSSVINHDYPYVQGVVLVIAVAVLLVNLLVDISYGWLDPKIRY